MDEYNTKITLIMRIILIYFIHMPPTSWTPRTSVPTTSWNGRVTTTGVTNTVSPIITGIWNDLNTWTETGKFWNDT